MALRLSILLEGETGNSAVGVGVSAEAAVGVSIGMLARM